MEKTVTPVINNRESLIQVQLAPKKTKTGTVAGKVLQLMPGANFLDTQEWEEAKANPVCASLLLEKIQHSRAPEQNPERAGMPYLVEKAPLSKDNPLGSVEAPDAVLLVAEMFDVPAMRRFMDQEQRPQVIAALRDQIAKIEKPELRRTKK